MKPLYIPRGKAKEYGDYAVNIYTGCPHRCYYCFAPSVLRKDRETFHSDVRPREGIVEALRSQLEREQITGKLVHLCFTCDPYPRGYDSSTTREVIEVLKDAGNHVQILTKNPILRDLDLLDENDWFGVTYDGSLEVGGFISSIHMFNLMRAHDAGIKTWISFEPVLNADVVLGCIGDEVTLEYVDKIKIGKLNYHSSDIDWKRFGHAVENLCKELGMDYYIKESLKAEMEKEEK